MMNKKKHSRQNIMADIHVPLKELYICVYIIIDFRLSNLFYNLIIYYIENIKFGIALFTRKQYNNI